MKRTGDRQEKGQIMVDILRWLVTELVQDRSPNAKGNRPVSAVDRRRRRL